MAKFIYVGPNQKTEGKKSSKAWTIRRRGRSVEMRYGPVESIGYGVGQRFHWAGNGPKVETRRFHSEARAGAYMKERIAVRKSHGYDALPGKVRILSPRRAGR